MAGSRSLSIIVPAYNEAANIAATIDNITAALATLPIRNEILVIDDGSRDGTGGIVDSHPNRAVRLVTNDRNRGFGWTYRRGVELAALDYIVMVHGDNAWSADTLRALFQCVGDADVVIGYTRNMWRSRSWTRTTISKTFTLFVNLITRRRLRYYNGLQIHPATVLKQLRIESTGYGFQAEVLAQSLRLTNTFVEVPMDLTERAHGESKAFRFKNVVDVVQTLGRLCALEWSASK
ncbi:MAG TPA: glycosyltransferase family 2 protein [Vicinamibacterales bacterium]|jgi:glycosyltransferase involved in cell wall biosynthesis|nr:glycosyltransferase family 2 protein [Vicinamibacterales bacterium]